MSRSIFSLLLLTVILNIHSHCQTLISNVNLVDVKAKKILKGYNVLCLEGKIVSIEKTKPGRIPEGATVIDGTGKYLAPGFIDAHVHFSKSGGLFTRPDAIDLRKYHPYATEIKWTHDNMEDLLRRYTSAGITSVIDVGTAYNFLAQRDSFKNKTYAPSISMTGPLLTTYVPEQMKNLSDDGVFILMKTEEGARESVREELAHKADFIKIWYIVLEQDKEAGARKNLPLVKAVIEEAHKNNLRVAVHATERITARLAVEAGADFLVHSVEDEIIEPDFIQLLKKKNVVLCPTLVVAGNYGTVFADNYTFSTDELSLANPFTIGSIIDYPQPDTTLAANYIKAASSERNKTRQVHDDSICLVNLHNLYVAGITIATGTDAGNIGTQHVSSYFNELRAMQRAGFTLWDLLIASTLNAAKAVGKENELGSIEKGKNANMVSLNANPLDSIANWRKIDVVINKGTAVKPVDLIVNTPEMLAQQQLNAYNAHDVEAFLAPYAEDVEIYEFPDKLISKGKEKMRADYQFIKKAPGLYCKLLNRIVEGNMVIDHEEIYVTGRKPFNGIAIYHIENGKIRKVYFPK